MTRFLHFIDSLSTWVGKSFAWLILVLTLGISYEVFVRYVLRAPTTWAFDFSYINYGALFLMAGAYTLSRNGHVRADVVYRLWKPRTQASFDLVALHHLLSARGRGLDVCGLELRGACRFGFREVSIFSPAGVPVFPLKTLIPITGLLLFIQGIAEIIRCILCIRLGQWPQRLHDVEETESLILQEKRIHAAEAEQNGSEGNLSMTDPQVGMLMLGLFIFIIMLGFPIAFTLIAMGVGFGYYAYYTPGQDIVQNRVFTLLVQKTFEVTSSDVLMAVPVVPVHGVPRRTSEHSRSPVPFAADLHEERPRRARRGDAGHLRHVRDRDRYRRRGRDPDGAARVPGHAASGLRRKALRGRGVRRRLPRHPDPAEHPADRLRGDCRRLGGEALCRGLHPGFLAHPALYRLRDHPGDDQPEARAEAAERANRRPIRPSAVVAGDLVSSARAAHRQRARCDSVRAGDAIGGRRRRSAGKHRARRGLWRAQFHDAARIRST